MPLKAFASPCALLLGVLTEIVERFFFHLFVHQGALVGLTRSRCAGHSVYCTCGVTSGVCCPSALWW